MTLYMHIWGKGKGKARVQRRKQNRVLAVVLFACYLFEAFCYYIDGYPVDSGSILNFYCLYSF